MRVFPVLLLASASIVSCADDHSLPEFGELVWDGEHLQVWATQDARTCGGSFQALDQHAQQVSEYVGKFGVQANAQRYRYYWISEEENEVFDPCPNAGAACFRGTTIYAARYSSHEVVHSEFASNHSSFVDEGLAVMLGGFGINEVVDTHSVEHIIRETQGRQLHNDHYDSAGKFIGAMRELYPEEYLPPVLDTRRSDDFEQFSSIMNDAGIEVDSVVDFNETETACRFGTYRLALSECSIPPTPWNTENEWTVSGVIDCASEDTIGPDATGAIWTVRSFDIAEAGTYSVTAVTDGFGVLSACRTPWCGSAFTGAFQPPGWALLVSTVATSVEMQPGRYWIRVQQDIDDPPAPFQLTLARSPDGE